MTKLLFALVFMTAGLAHAYTPCPPGVPAWECDNVNPNPIDRWPDRDIPGHAPDYGHSHPITCAPEVVQGNVAATERVLAQLAKSPEFASASQFTSTLASISHEKSANTKVARYFALIGVDANDSSAVAEFVGAREVRGQWLSSLEQSTGLTAAQSSRVATELQTALRGNLQ